MLPFERRPSSHRASLSTAAQDESGACFVNASPDVRCPLEVRGSGAEGVRPDKRTSVGKNPDGFGHEERSIANDDGIKGRIREWEDACVGLDLTGVTLVRRESE